MKADLRGRPRLFFKAPTGRFHCCEGDRSCKCCSEPDKREPTPVLGGQWNLKGPKYLQTPDCAMGQRQQQVGVVEPRLRFVVWVGVRRELTGKEGAVTTPQIRELGTEL